MAWLEVKLKSFRYSIDFGAFLALDYHPRIECAAALYPVNAGGRTRGLGVPVAAALQCRNVYALLGQRHEQVS